MVIIPTGTFKAVYAPFPSTHTHFEQETMVAIFQASCQCIQELRAHRHNMVRLSADKEEAIGIVQICYCREEQKHLKLYLALCLGVRLWGAFLLLFWVKRYLAILSEECRNIFSWLRTASSCLPNCNPYNRWLHWLLWQSVLAHCTFLFPLPFLVIFFKCS